MSELLAQITEDLASGLWPDLPLRSPPLWADGRNIYFEQGKLNGGLGESLLFNPSDRSEVLGITTSVIDGEKTIIYGTGANLWKWTEAGGVVDITNTGGDYTGTSDNLWRFELWGDFISATNNKDAPQILKTTEFEDMTVAALTTVSGFVEHTPHMLAYATSDDPREIIWSDVDAVEDYTNGAASGLPVRGLSSEILCAEKLGEIIAIYSSDEIRAASYIRAPYVYGVKPRLRGFGLVGRCALVNAVDRHYGFGPRGLWVTNGVSAEYISTGIVQKFIYNNLNRDKMHKVVGYNDKLRNMVIFFYPTEDSLVNNRGVGYNYKNNTFTLFNYGRSAAVDDSVFSFGITGDENGNLYFSSVTDVPAYNGNNPTIPVGESGAITAGYGEFGFGELGFGGVLTI